MLEEQENETKGEEQFKRDLLYLQRILTELPFGVVFSITLKFAIAFLLVNLSFGVVIGLFVMTVI